MSERHQFVDESSVLLEFVIDRAYSDHRSINIRFWLDYPVAAYLACIGPKKYNVGFRLNSWVPEFRFESFVGIWPFPVTVLPKPGQ